MSFFFALDAVRPVNQAAARVFLIAALALLAVLAGMMRAQAQEAPEGTLVRNIANVTYQVNGTPQPDVISNPADIYVLPPVSPPEIELLRYAPADPDAVEYNVNGSDALIDGTMMPLPEPTESDASMIDTSTPVALSPAMSLIPDETLFISVTDESANLDSGQIDTIEVVLTVSDTGDEETVRLYETGPDTGVFIGYVKTSGNGTTESGDGALSVQAGSVIEAAYQDDSDPETVIFDTTVVDASAFVFDSSTGNYVDGSKITLMNADTGEPAVVYGIDRVSTYPSTVVSGENVVDESGKVYVMSTGEFRFPVVPEGNYYLFIEPPTGYQSPSTAFDAELQQLWSAPFTLGDASRGLEFEMLAMGALDFDIPLDPLESLSKVVTDLENLELTKTVSSASAQIGDFLRYELVVTNRSGETVTNVTVVDQMPYGFRYQSGSLRVDGEKSTPVVSSDGAVLDITIPQLGVNESAKIIYIVEVTVAAGYGLNINTAIATAPGGYQSGPAEAEVWISDAFMRDTITIVGRISAGACNPEDDWPREIVQGESVQGVRVYMEDGTFVVSDEDGEFHFRGVTPGTHVVQMDTNSLPPGYVPVLCEENTRVAGNPKSRFVDIHGGHLWRANFYLKNVCEETAVPKISSSIFMKDGTEIPDWMEPEPVIGVVTAPRARTRSTGVNDEASARAECENIKAAAGGSDQGGEADEQDFESETSASLMKKYNSAWLAGQTAEGAWVYPDPSGSAPQPSVKFGIKHAVGQKVTVLLEGEKVSVLHIAGVTRSADGKVAITHWRGVDIKDGPNRFTVIIKNAEGREVARFNQTIYYVSEVHNVDLVEEQSVLVADGRTSPEIAIRLTDKSGRPVNRGAYVNLEVEAPYRAVSSKKRFEERPLTETYAAQVRAVVGENGIAKVVLEPTMRTGAVKLHVKLTKSALGSSEKTIEAWLSPGDREWILVGLAEGSVGLDTVRDKMEGGGGDDFSIDGRVALYATGTIKGEWLLTISLDTDRRRGDRDMQVFRQIDPNAYYTLYGDTTSQDNDAESRYPLYVKLERKNFYALFGDYNTDMTQTELTAFGRRLSGLKVAYRDERFDVVAFGSETNQAFVLEEKLSLGTSGPYRLTNTPIVRNSEVITVETRDRFRNDVVLETRRLIRFIDYSIDYDTGVVTLKQPVPVTDIQFNPNLLVFSYEAVNPVNRNLTYGGRAAVKFMDERVELGLSYIHDGGSITAPDVATDVVGVDLHAQITENTEFRAEYATSSRDNGEDGDAFLLDLLHETDNLKARLYFQQQDENYGVGQLSLATRGTRRYGVELDYVLQPIQNDDRKLGDITIAFDAFREESLTKDAARNVVEADVGYTVSGKELSFGIRHIGYEGADLTDQGSVTQLLAGARMQLEDSPLTVYTSNEISLSGHSDVDFDTRYLLGADYRFTEWLTGTAVVEQSEGSGYKAESIRLALSATPWDGGTLTASAQNTTGLGENGDRLAAVFGVGQTYAVTEKLSLSAGYEQQILVSGAAEDLPASPFTDTLNSEEYRVANIGFGYIEDGWSASSRVEYRTDDTESRLSLNAGLVGDFSENLSAALWASASRTEPKDGSDARDELSVSVAGAYRPLDSGPIFLNRLDAEYSRQGVEKNVKFIENFVANLRLGERGEASVHLGAKYANQTIDDEEFNGVSYFAGTELIYDVTEKLDIGFHAGFAKSLNSGITDYVWGPSVGYNVAKNAWFSLGYNVRGIRDEDFGDATFSSRGLYLKFRLKFDQDTVRNAVNAMRLR